MKIKLSKSQWEQIGKTAGWIKVSQSDEFMTFTFRNREFELAYRDSHSEIVGKILKAFSIPQSNMDTFVQTNGNEMIEFSDGNKVSLREIASFIR